MPRESSAPMPMINMAFIIRLSGWTQSASLLHLCASPGRSFEPTLGRWLAKDLASVPLPVNADISPEIGTRPMRTVLLAGNIWRSM
jgi:hypothetical protein